MAAQNMNYARSEVASVQRMTGLALRLKETDVEAYLRTSPPPWVEVIRIREDIGMVRYRDGNGQLLFGAFVFGIGRRAEFSEMSNLHKRHGETPKYPSEIVDGKDGTKLLKPAVGESPVKIALSGIGTMTVADYPIDLNTLEVVKVESVPKQYGKYDRLQLKNEVVIELDAILRRYSPEDRAHILHDMPNALIEIAESESYGRNGNGTGNDGSKSSGKRLSVQMRS